MKIPRWAQILIGIAIVVVFLGIGAVIAITAWFSQNITHEDATARQADEAFEKVRQQFGGRPPLFELKDGRPQLVPERAAAPAAGQALQNLHVLVWDPRDEQLSRMSVPWWIIRMKSGPVRFGAYTSGWDDNGVRVTAEDIEKRGPGVIIEVTGDHEEHVLVWVQ